MVFSYTKRGFYKTAILGIAGICFSASLAISAETEAPEIIAGEVKNQRRITENFNGDDRTLMMGGQINFHFPEINKTVWNKTVLNGKLIMENRAKTDQLHYDDISWVR